MTDDLKDAQVMMRKAMVATSVVLDQYAVANNTALCFALLVWPVDKPDLVAFSGGGSGRIGKADLHEQTHEAVQQLAENFHEHNMIVEQ